MGPSGRRRTGGGGARARADNLFRRDGYLTLLAYLTCRLGRSESEEHAPLITGAFEILIHKLGNIQENRLVPLNFCLSFETERLNGMIGLSLNARKCCIIRLV